MIKQKQEKQIIFNLISIHENFLRAKKLTPSPVINNHFSKLVTIVDTTSKKDSKKVLTNKKISLIKKDFLKFSSEGEFELEYFWAKKIVRSKNPYNTLLKFPYLKNYKDLIDFEISYINQFKSKIKKILFIGSGPLPLSIILLEEKYNVLIDTVDINKNACTLSRKIINKLKTNQKINIFNKNIFSMADFSDYDIIFVAALVGKTQKEKGLLIKHVEKYAAQDTYLILRSVSDLGVLLYPEIPMKCFKKIDVLKKTRRQKGLINNIVIGKIK